jgi:ankyrin repeat domain-containing protein 50
VAKHLQSTFQDENGVAITCIYLNYKEQNEQSVPVLIASLLKQMVQDRPTISENVKVFYERHRHQNTRPILDDFIEALKVEIGTYSRVFILVDALDECENHETRANLLRILRSILTSGTVRLLVTSRDLLSIAGEFRATKRLDIIAHNQDIRRYLEGRIATGPTHLKRLQEYIISQVVQNAAGM